MKKNFRIRKTKANGKKNNWKWKPYAELYHQWYRKVKLKIKKHKLKED